MLPKAYDPQGTEDRIYTMWEESGAFKADNKSKKEPFVISMPPPNATGQLHLGHAVMLALEDIFTRFARMQGKEALWVPGTDHAAIATESVVIKKIQKEEKIKDPRAHYGREKLVAKIAEFVDISRGTIRSQVRKMGSSCDWSRERYTLDASLNRCVNEVFKKMYADGLIYRGHRVVNWDTALQTTISDDEIEYEEVDATLTTFEYLSAAQTGGAPVLVATSRPETKLGDSALVVHPDDVRYKALVGRTFDVQWPRGQKIRVAVIADRVVDPAFGTGVLGLTPYHSKVDYELWQRHRKEIPSDPIQVVGEDGRITSAIQGYAGLTVEECRAQFVKDLEEQGKLAKQELYRQPLSISYRSKKAVEPLPKLQWFIDVNKTVVPWKGKNVSLKQVMQDVIRSKDIRIIPERFEKTYFQWIDNLQDWCISRQIWWGHRIPVYYCSRCATAVRDGKRNKELGMKNEENDQSHNSLFIIPNSGEAARTVSVYSIAQCPHCGGPVEQDPDTLDTWFSSGLWTWSTLIDPNLAGDMSLSLQDLLKKSPDFQKFHPTSVMETGYDILFFWVARMILMTTYATGQIPFKHVYLHGLVRTRDGKKMSKSDPATCIDPLEIIPKYGADALRLSMIVGQSPGNDFRLYEEKIAGYRNFINKLWNASRFVLMQCEKAGVDPKEVGKGLGLGDLSVADRALLSSLQGLVEDVTAGLAAYRLSDVGERLYGFVWDYFCDWYLELSKGESNPAVLVHALRTIVHLLHPYCPFVTEEIWGSIAPSGSGPLIREPWPTLEKKFADREAEERLQLLIDVISTIRSLRVQVGISHETKIMAQFKNMDVHRNFLWAHASHIERLAGLGNPGVCDAYDKRMETVDIAASTLLKNGIEISISGAKLSDDDKALLMKKLLNEKQSLESFIVTINGKLGNSKFMDHAKKEVIELEKQKLKDTEAKLAKIEERLKALS